MEVYDDIICCNCTIKNLLDDFKIEIEHLEDTPKIKVFGYGEDDTYICKECDVELEPLDMYFICEDDFKECKRLIINEIAKILSKKIDYCFNCEGDDIVDYERRAEELGIPYKSTGQSVNEFLCDNKVPEIYIEEVMPNLRCSNCGYGEENHPKYRPESSNFDYYDKIFTKEEIMEFWGAFEDNLIYVAKIYDVEISLELIDDFIQWCFDNPMLSYKHELAKSVFEVLEKVKGEPDNVLRVQTGKSLYRGRCRAKDKKKYEVSNLGMPPKGLASHGRYNLVGTSVLYLTDNKLGIPYEIEPKKNEVVDVAEFKIQKELLLFDVDTIFNDFSSFINKENDESTLVKRNYLFTNFIASACKDVGFDGIYYKGAGNKAYYNFAIFETGISKIKENQYVETIEYKTEYDLV